MVPLAGGLLFLVLLGIHFSAGAGRVHACSCAGPPAPHDAFTYSAAVFSGALVSVNEWGVAEFEVHTLWKGPLAATILIFAPGPCGHDFDESHEGTEYLVYAQRGVEPGMLAVGLCGRTRSLRGAEEDLEVLGEGLSLAGGGDPRAPVLLQDELTQLGEGRVPWVVTPAAAMRSAPSVWTVMVLMGIAGALVALARLTVGGAEAPRR